MVDEDDGAPGAIVDARDVLARMGTPQPRFRDVEVNVLFNALACVAFFDWQANEPEPGPRGFRHRFRVIGEKAVELPPQYEGGDPGPGLVTAHNLAEYIDIPASLTERQVEEVKRLAANAASVVMHEARGVRALHEWFAVQRAEARVSQVDWQAFENPEVWCRTVDGWTCAAQALADALVTLATKGRRQTVTRGVALGTLRAVANKLAPLLYQRDALITVVASASGLTGGAEGAFYDVFTWLVNEAKKTDGQRVAVPLKPRQTIHGAVAQAIGMDTNKQREQVRAALEYGAKTMFRGVMTPRQASSLWMLNEDRLAGVAWIQLGDMLSPRYAQTVAKMLDTAEGKAALREARVPARLVKHDLLLIPTPETATLPLESVGTSERVGAKRLFLHMLAEMAGHAYLDGAKIDLVQIGKMHGLSPKVVDSIQRAWMSAKVVVITPSGGMQLGDHYAAEHDAMLATAKLSDNRRRGALKGAEAKRLAAAEPAKGKPTKRTAKQSRR